MQAVAEMPMLVAAAQYSIAYLLCGGGVFGAIVIYFVAKAFGR